MFDDREENEKIMQSVFVVFGKLQMSDEIGFMAFVSVLTWARTWVGE